MKELIEKIASYNIFNFLLPGTLFAVLVERLTTYKIIQRDIIIDLFVYYFIGLVISRIGSLALEPLLKKSKFLIFSDYKSFLAASKNDVKIELLSEMNNVYRNLCSLFIVFFILKIYNILELNYSIAVDVKWYLILAVLLITFLLSYRKQTKFIKNRVEINTENFSEGK